jgi:hypothetical protein
MDSLSGAELARQLQSSFDRLRLTLTELEAVEIIGATMANGMTPAQELLTLAREDWAGVERIVPNLQPPPAPQESDALWGLQTARTFLCNLVSRDHMPAQVITNASSGETLQTLLQTRIRATKETAYRVALFCGSTRRWRREQLRTFLIDRHHNLMASIGGLTEAALLTERVCGKWSIRDLLCHVLAWNEWPSPRPETIQRWMAAGAIDAINDQLMEERAALDMIGVADGLMTYHRRIVRALSRSSDEALASIGDLGWGESGELSYLFYTMAVHEAEHAEEIWRWRAGAAA